MVGKSATFFYKNMSYEQSKSNMRPEGHLRPMRCFREVRELISWAESNWSDVATEFVTSRSRYMKSFDVYILAHQML